MAKVSIIEDNKEIARVYERAFHLGGYEVEVIHTGTEALQRLEAKDEPPSIVLLDVIIPGVSGIDVLRKYKEDERFKHVPIVILTNSLGSNDEKLFLSLGADRYMVKLDNDPSDVVREANKLLGRTN